MLLKSNAIILRTVRYGDGGLVVDALTSEAGRVTFFCHLSSSRRGRLKRQIFQPLSVLSVEFDYRPRLRMQRFKNVSVAVPFATIPFDARKSAIALFVAEFLGFAIRGEQQDRRLFDYIVDSLLWLDGAQRSFANFHIVFMLRMSSFLGFYPNMEGFEAGSWFDLRDGVFTHRQPVHNDAVAPEEARLIGLLMRLRFSTMHLLAMSRSERNRCTDLILRYYRLHIPDFPELKSLGVLRELFG